jgi:hypothetical protein
MVVSIDEWTHVAASVTSQSIDYCAFGGTNEYAKMGDVAALSFERTDSFSLSFWIQSGSSSGYIVAKADAEVRGYGISFPSAGKLAFSLLGTSTQALEVDTTNSVISGTTWTHVVSTYDGSSTPGGVCFYINGAPTAVSTIKDTLASTIVNAAEFNLFSRLNGTSVGSGDMHDMAVYNKELSQAEVTAIYGGGVAPDLLSVGPTANLVGWWKCSGDVYPTLTDSSISGNDGDMVNMEAGDLTSGTTKLCRFFKNGVFVDQIGPTIGPTGGTTADVSVGADEGGSNPFIGGIAEVHLSSVARSDGYIAASYAAQEATEDGDTLALWKLQDVLPEVKDEGAFGLHLGIGVPAPYIIRPFVNGADYARWLDTSNYLASPQRSEIRNVFDPANDMTFECWFRVEETGPSDITLFSYGGSGETLATNVLFQLGLTWATRKLRLFWEYGSGSDIITASTNPLWVAGIETGDYEVHYLAVTRTLNGALLDVDIYVDGALVDNTLRGLAIPTGGTTDWVTMGGGDDFALSDVRISNVVRTPSEILTAYNAGVIGGGTIYYLMRGWDVLIDDWEVWTNESVPTINNNPSGHALTDVTILSSWVL